MEALYAETVNVLELQVLLIISIAVFVCVVAALQMLCKLSGLNSLAISGLCMAPLPWLAKLMNYRINAAGRDELMVAVYIVLPAICGVILLATCIRRLLPVLKQSLMVDTEHGSDKERILAMVETGKITAAQGADLLGVLGRSSAVSEEQKFSRPDLAALAGVILGFFLPWQRFNLNMIPFSPSIGAVTATQAG